MRRERVTEAEVVALLRGQQIDDLGDLLHTR
jgi:hypothetical protein